MVKAFEKTRRVTIEVSETDCGILGVLDAERSVENVLLTLVSHAKQGVYRPGSWEREWLMSVFSDEFTARLEPGDPYGRTDCDLIFQRPRANGTPPAPALHKLNATEGK